MRECRTSERCISIGLGSQRADGLRLMRDMGLVRNALCSKLQVDVMLWACRRLSATVPTGVVVGFYCNIVPGMFYVLFYARHKSVDGQKKVYKCFPFTLCCHYNLYPLTLGNAL